MKIEIFGSLPATWEDFFIQDKSHPLRLITLLTRHAWDEVDEEFEGPYPAGTTRLDGDTITAFTILDELTEVNVRPVLCELLEIEDSQLELAQQNVCQTITLNQLKS